jgi:cell division protein FtsN
MRSLAMKSKFVFLACSLVFSSTVFAQLNQVETYLAQIENGNYSEARQRLPGLIQDHPKDPSVIYLRGVLETNGEKAYGYFKQVADKHQTSQFHDDAIMRVSEYLFAKGLYITAEKYLKLIPIQHPRSPHLERAANMLINSMNAAGKTDSSRIWQSVLSEQFPRIQMNEGAQQERLQGSEVSSDDQKAESDADTRVVEQGRANPAANQPNARPFTLQVGAFSTLDNAMQEKDNLESQGFNVQVLRRQRGDLDLYLVWVGQYRSHEEAEVAGRKIQEQTDYSFFVVNTAE